MTGKLEDFIKEDKIIKELLVPRNKLIMVMGGADPSLFHEFRQILQTKYLYSSL